MSSISAFDGFSRTPSNTYFNHLNPSYNNERMLYDLLITEAYNKHGVCCSYIVVSFNTNYDKLFQEDNNRRIERRFDLMCYFDLPYETRTFSNSIGWSDVFHVYSSKRHLSAASRIDYVTKLPTYSPYIPKVGDILETSYNGVFYEIISVKAQEEQFLQQTHSWDFVVRVIRDKSFQFNPDTSATMQDLSQYMGQEDLFNIGEFIDNAKGEILYQPPSTECSPRDPFNDWWS